MEITVEKADVDSAELILEGQRKSFLPLLDRYQDHNVNPCNEKLESIKSNIKNHYFYKILVDRDFAGAIFIEKNPDHLHLKLHTIYILPEYQNFGIGQKAIELVENIHNKAIEWYLETPHDLTRNHHVYEKKGYRRTGREDKINSNLTIVHFKKEVRN